MSVNQRLRQVMLTAVHPVEGLAGLQVARGLASSWESPWKSQAEDFLQSLITSTYAADKLQGHSWGKATTLKLQLQPVHRGWLTNRTHTVVPAGLQHRVRKPHS